MSNLLDLNQRIMSYIADSIINATSPDITGWTNTFIFRPGVYYSADYLKKQVLSQDESNLNNILRVADENLNVVTINDHKNINLSLDKSHVHLTIILVSLKDV